MKWEYLQHSLLYYENNSGGCQIQYIHSAAYVQNMLIFSLMIQL